MSIFTNILQHLGIGKPAAAAPTGTASAKPPVGPLASGVMPSAMPAMQQSAHVAVVDVVSKLDKLAAGSPGMDWKTSIVDMLKLLGMDSSLNARKELATELGCPADMMGGDHSKMNIWLHETVLQKIADNGGNIPQSMLKK